MTLEQIITAVKICVPLFLFMAGVIVYYFKDRTALRKDFFADNEKLRNGLEQHMEKLDMEFENKIILLTNNITRTQNKIQDVDKNSISADHVQIMIANSIAPMIAAQESTVRSIDKMNENLLLFMKEAITQNSANTAKIESLENRANKS